MAFDRPIEADRVEDLGLFASFLRAPVVGTILWLLGGEDAKKAEEEERREKQGRQSQEEDQQDDTFRDYELSKGRDGNDVVDRGKRGAYNCPAAEDGASSSMMEPWPQISSGVDSDEDDLANHFPHYEKFVTSQLSTPRPSSHVVRQNSSGPASRVVDELVAIMDASSIDDKSGKNKRSPKRSSSRSDLVCLDTGCTNTTEIQSCPSSFASKQKTLTSKESSQNLSSKSNSANQSDSNMRVKKMSWSDETGERSLVEYFDERIHQCRYKRSNSWKPSRSISFDSQDKASSPPLSRGGRSKVRVIKSALKRSGSYSPPTPMYAAASQSTDSACETTSSRHSSNSGMKSFRSISVVGSVSSDSTCTDSSNGESRQQHVPSSLQGGCGRASGGLIFPTGGPNCFPSYQLTLGTAALPPATAEGTCQEEEAKLCSALDSESVTPTLASSNTTWIHNNNNRHSKPHHFLPHHSNGYISPQYGFYVNITPPTPEMFYPRPPPGPPSHDKRSATMQQQSYQQFQRQQPYRPSPIPEVATVACPSKDNDTPCQPMFEDGNMDGGSKRKERPLKPGFNKNMRMGMFLSENPHQVWPTVPFG